MVTKDLNRLKLVLVEKKKTCVWLSEQLGVSPISALSAQLKGYKSRHIAPGAHWLFNDKLLSDIYDETYPFEE